MTAIHFGFQPRSRWHVSHPVALRDVGLGPGGNSVRAALLETQAWKQGQASCEGNTTGGSVYSHLGNKNWWGGGTEREQRHIHISLKLDPKKKNNKELPRALKYLDGMALTMPEARDRRVLAPTRRLAEMGRQGRGAGRAGQPRVCAETDPKPSHPQESAPSHAAGRTATRSSRAPTSWHGTTAHTRGKRSSAALSATSASCAATTSPSTLRRTRIRSSKLLRPE